MTTMLDETTSPREARAASRDGPQASKGSSRASMSAPVAKTSRALIAVVAVLALAAGAAGMFGVQRFLARQAPAATGTHTSPQPAAMPATETGPGIGGHPTGAAGNVVYISPARQQLIGVRTATVTHQALDADIRTVGTLAYDETRVTHIHTKIAGWVDRLYVDYAGRRVQQGEPLFTVYSPELVSTQKEYLLALKARNQLGASQFEETRSGVEALVGAARERLRLWDISDDQIAELERTGEPRRALTLYSPFSGIVLEREAYAGQYVTPEMSTFKIADLSTIWVLGQVFEYELRNVRIGQDARIEFPYAQSTRTLRGRVTYVYPEIDPQTRRATVRIEFRNPGLEFKPQTYVTVVLKAERGHQLAVPKEAVIDTGARQYTILAHPDGYFEPRDVHVGPPADQYYPVISGLADGDRVVTSAQFLVDSEANLQAALQAMSMSMPGMDMSAIESKKGLPTPKPDMAGPPASPPDHRQHKP